jgi:hypothetical protein
MSVTICEYSGGTPKYPTRSSTPPVALQMEQVKIRVLEPSNTRQHISTWPDVISFVID